MTIYFASDTCWLGTILVAQSEKGVCAILLGDNRQSLVADLQKRFHHIRLVEADSSLQKTMSQIIGAIENPKLPVATSLDIHGTPFQQRVWQALQQIPTGETRSYSEIAAAINAPKSVRAVATACAANPIAVIIPCHRVLRRDGSLSGYRWGLERKEKLLRREAIYKTDSV
ncbi:methylated-DNA--[protein]-cysteine S-methyltransferase [Cellvibrio sp. OA-2007]|uniref:methylated-DNA--[protein]-cysteine S-methyltransferase n=1 Tax=Cellvibrio sp. OA-2007 TaxID=529823 RepID=UPI000784B24F|nr:methylated-DNA--[protein]-cysteine S-methyltransferase [Cellvibrio sp. OA-2007]